MKATDLMIGDWVLYGKRYAIVKRIEYSRCDILVSVDACHDDIVIETYDNIEPIPITPEILKKNGFCLEDSGYYVFTDYDKLHIVCDWRNEIKIIQDYNISLSIGINFVHELQHALRLCGIDKEITLWLL